MSLAFIRRLPAFVALTIAFVTGAAVRADEPRPSIVFAARETATPRPLADWAGPDRRDARLAVAASGNAGESRFDPKELFSRPPFEQIGFVLLFTGLALGALWLAFADRPIASDVDAPAVDAVRTSRNGPDLLAALIGNALPVVDEPLLFPPLAQIHGRPIENPRYRVEAAHAIAGPHFVQTTGNGAPAANGKRFRVIAARIDRPSGVPRRPSTLDRVLAAVERGPK